MPLKYASLQNNDCVPNILSAKSAQCKKEIKN